MKKFLSKLPVMITFVVLAVLVLALNIGMLARPVSYGMTYKSKITENGKTVEASYKFKNSKVVETKGDMDLGIGNLDVTMDAWVLKDGYTMVVVGIRLTDSVVELMKSSGAAEGMTDEEIRQQLLSTGEFFDEDGYDAAVKEYWDMSSEERDAVKKERGMKVNAFRMKSADETATCAGAIVYAVIMGIVDLALITFATLSVVFFVLDKKQSKQTTEQQAAQLKIKQ